MQATSYAIIYYWETDSAVPPGISGCCRNHLMSQYIDRGLELVDVMRKPKAGSISAAIHNSVGGGIVFSCLCDA